MRPFARLLIVVLIACASAPSVSVAAARAVKFAGVADFRGGAHFDLSGYRLLGGSDARRVIGRLAFGYARPCTYIDLAQDAYNAGHRDTAMSILTVGCLVVRDP